MEVASEGESRTDEPAALAFPICLWVPSPSPESRLYDQTPHVPGLLRLRTGIRVTGRSCTQYGLASQTPLGGELRRITSSFYREDQEPVRVLV
jgi:hypothetical protein